MSTQSQQPGTASGAPPSPSSSLPKLGPAWYRAAGGHKGGFRPPPAVPLVDGKDGNAAKKGGLQRDRASSIGSGSSGGNVNSFSALLYDDEDDEPRPSNSPTSGAGGSRSSKEGNATSQLQNIRSDALLGSGGRPLFQRTLSGGEKGPTSRPTGRTLADLAASVPAAGPGRASTIGYIRKTESGSAGAGASAGAGGRSEDPGFRRSVDDPDKPVIRYTREKLLAMRPASAESLPEALKHVEGIVILADQAQDPVSFDEFDADEIWASALPRARGVVTAVTIAPKSSVVPTESRRTSSHHGDNGGRWERGVALPPPSEEGHRRGGGEIDASSPDELWDDPLGTASTKAASDFSAFGVSMNDIMDDRPRDSRGVSGVFDMSKLSEAALKFEEEFHSNNNPESGAETSRRDVDPSRPLASAGTTIRSGSGDEINVFEDFDDTLPVPLSIEEPAAVEKPVDELVDANGGTGSEVNVAPTGEEAVDVPIPSIGGSNADTASSRLMQMIGVGGSDDSPSNVISAWGSGVAAAEPKTSFNIPRNPWGEPVSSTSASQEAEWKALQEAELQRQRQEEAALEEQKRVALQKLREQEELEKRKRIAQQQEAARQAAAAQQPSQVEMVLMERVSTLLENSWGKADLMTILTALHRDDARVVPLLGNIDALRALILRHPNRIQIGRDPAYGVDVAALIMTNAQFLQHQQQEELQRQRLLHARQQQAAQQAEAQARAAFQQQQQERPKVINAPWYYADPQGNIQGPFGGDEMRQWLDGGYFKEDLPISQNPHGPFRALSVFFPDWSVAFLPISDRSGAELAKAEQERKLAEEKAREAAVENERMERERAENERLERERAEQERADRERAEQQRIELVRLEKERLERELREKNRKEKETAAAAASSTVIVDQNASSVQLKMLLGLGGSVSATQQALVDDAAENRNGVAVTVQTQSKPRTSATELSYTAPAPSTAAAPVAWGGASQSQVGRKKSMSEIQQEEARVAARLAKEREAFGNLTRSNSGGWANVAAAGTSTWSSSAVKPTPAILPAPSQTAAAVVKPGATASMQQVRAKQQAQLAAAQKQVLSQKQRESNSSSDDFGAKMSPALESWCKEQLRKITGSDDLTLVSFCTTLRDDAEIRQYLIAYLGSSPQVNSFASEFINRKNGGKGQAEEWETTAKSKSRKGKKAIGSK